MDRLVAGFILLAALLAPVTPAVDARAATLAGDLDARLAAGGFRRGAALFIRIAKQESELEVFLARHGRFERFAVYPICFRDGTLGPKLAEGDHQAPEGFYAFGEAQLRWRGHWRRGLDIGYPNAFDKANRRTGSAIYIHGGCTSLGCFAMTDPVIEDVFELSVAALDAGQRRIAVHVFPFRMTEARLAEHAASPWIAFWRDLKAGHDLFETTGVPPRLSVCAARYRATAGPPGYDGSEALRLACEDPVPARDRLAEGPARRTAAPAVPGRLMARLLELRTRSGPPSLGAATAPAAADSSDGSEAQAIAVRCKRGLPSCRRWIALKLKAAVRPKLAAGEGKP